MKISAINQILCGDAQQQLTQLPDHCIDLIFTSPPYANQRRKQYPSVATIHYVDWFASIAEQLYRVLKPTGTFILNIKENVINGEKSCYVLELILMLRQQGWLWTEEFIWHKKNSVPGKWPNRFRDAWERLLQFNKQKKFCMYQEAVMIPISPSTVSRMQRLKAADRVLKRMKTGSPFARNLAHWLNKDKVYPCNVLYLATESHNQQHCAAFPKKLPAWFIQLFTQQQDIVLDPFIGSGTTALAACELNRGFIGIDICPHYCEVARNRLSHAIDKPYIPSEPSGGINVDFLRSPAK
jgi:site-specific DNA-methyltransferase (adenine-specific)